MLRDQTAQTCSTACVAAVPMIGEPLGAREVLALGLTLGGVALALGKA
jgi:hypothetical protein